MGAIDYFLKLEGIEGESADQKHKGEISLESWGFGATQPRAAGGGGAGRVNLQDLHFVTKMSKASPKLFLSCTTGQHIRQAVLVARKASAQQEFYKITLSDLLVSSYQNGGTSTQGDTLDEVSLNFSKIEIQYQEQKPDGSLGAISTAGYDFLRNVKI